MSLSRDVLTVVTYSFSTGGSERIAAAVAKHAANQSIPTTVCATHGGPGPLSRELEAAGVPCVALSDGPGGRVGREIRLGWLLRRTGTTVLHAHHMNMLAIAYRPARAAGVRRIVVTEHSNHQMRTRPQALALAKRFAPRADRITVVHEGLAEYVTSTVGVERARLTVIPNGVDTTRFVPGLDDLLLRELEIDASTCVFGSVGRLHPDKDPMNLARAVDLIPARFKDLFRLVVVGAGELRSELESFIADRHLRDTVRLLGERADVARLMRSFDVFVLSSRTEGLPVALLEAMSSGLAVIATDVGGVADAIADAGMIVPAQDPTALAEAMVALIGDAERRRQLGERARQRVKSAYDRSQMLAAYHRALFPESGA